RAMVITLVAQRDLHILQHLAGGQIVVTIDRLIVGVTIVGRIVAVGRIPITASPIIIAAAEENKTGVRVSCVPPASIVWHHNDIPLRDRETIPIDWTRCDGPLV